MAMILTRPRLAVLGTVCLVALTGCGGGGSATPASESEAGGLRAPAPAADRAATQSFSGTQVGKPGVDVQEQAIIRKGDVSIRTPEPQQARDGVDALLVRLHGSLDDERTVYDKSGRIRDSHLVLRVPVASFGTAMDDLEQLGTVVHSSSTGQDVTTEVIDVQQRLRTLRISLHDLNAFQRRATTIDQLLRFENAITERRGQYQSLKAQRDHLADQTSMSTIALDISLPPTHVVTVAHPAQAGFVSGLRQGWTALTGTVRVALTALGAVLPFAVLLAVVGLPLWWWLRHAGRHRPTTPAVETTSGE